jgi:hypothetical protein
MKSFFYVIALLASLLAGLILVLGLVTANGAPQESAVAAIAVAVAVIPYVFARAVEKLGKPESTKLLEQIQAALARKGSDQQGK